MVDGKNHPESARHDDGPLESGANTTVSQDPMHQPARAVHRRVELKTLDIKKSLDPLNGWGR